MRENSATVQSRSLLFEAAKRRHPAGSARRTDLNSGRQDRGSNRGVKGHGCPLCGGRQWVRAVDVLPLEIRCPACSVATDNPYPVDSATRRCCGGIGRHTRACEVAR